MASSNNNKPIVGLPLPAVIQRTDGHNIIGVLGSGQVSGQVLEQLSEQVPTHIHGIIPFVFNFY
uniref:Uncharacterized protein n=1 Tax=viral metagenome TaxID=1070528 RepID=A0A6C0DYB3_9ZZZZ